MRCEEVQKYLDAFRTAEVSPEVRSEVVLHLPSCATCSAELGGIMRLAKRARSMRVRAPKQILGRVLSQVGDCYGKVDTVVGEFWVGFNTRGITMIKSTASNSRVFENAYGHQVGRPVNPGIVPERLATAIQQATMGTQATPVDVDLSGVSEFVRKVLLLLKKIPRGEVRPYNWLAREAGHPKAVRAVGSAMARNPIPFILPCHRVVPASGGIGQYGLGSRMKRELLSREGAPVAEIEDFARKGVRYIGCKTTGIYCLPTCRSARRIRTKNSVALQNLDEAREGNYRPCQRCRPPVLGS